jgi:hypothetical protein
MKKGVDKSPFSCYNKENGGQHHEKGTSSILPPHDAPTGEVVSGLLGLPQRLPKESKAKIFWRSLKLDPCSFRNFDFRPSGYL